MKILLTILLLAGSMLGQSFVRFDGTVTPAGTPNTPANVAVCQSGGSGGPPCTPLAVIYDNPNGGSQIIQPYLADMNGHFYFYAPPGSYAVQSYGTGYTTTLANITLVSTSGGSGLPTGCSGSTGIITCTVFTASSANGGIVGTEGDGSALTAAGGVDLLFPDSASHRWKQNPNNAGNLIVPGISVAGISGRLTKLAANGIDITDAGAQIQQANGTCAAPTYSFTTGAGTVGMLFDGTLLGLCNSNAGGWIGIGSTGLQIRSVDVYGFSSSTTFDVAGNDTGISRQAAGVLAIGTGAPGSTAGRVKASAYMSVGTTFTTNAGCTDSTLVGGASAGKFTIGQSTSCTTVVTMGNSATAPNGWSCWINDQTALPTIAFRQSASTTTTASFTGTGTSGDVLNFGCMGF